MYTDLLLTYLAEEFKAHNHKHFVLLIDGIKINDEMLFEYLCMPNAGCFIGIISENVVDQIGGDENAFLRLAEKINCFVFFKHGTGKTATTLAEVFGRYDYTKVEASQGVSKGFFNIVPRDRHDDVRYSTENRYRVMPEEITSLRASQAIIFDTTNDQIIHFN